MTFLARTQVSGGSRPILPYVGTVNQTLNFNDDGVYGLRASFNNPSDIGIWTNNGNDGIGNSGSISGNTLTFANSITLKKGMVIIDSVTSVNYGTITSDSGTSTTWKITNPSNFSTSANSNLRARKQYLFVADQSNHQIRRIDICAGYVSSHVYCDSAPRSICIVGNYIYSAHTARHTIIRYPIDAVTFNSEYVISGGTIIAGADGTSGYVDSTTATSVRFNSPEYMVSDGTYLYLSDTGNHRIRKINISTGATTTLAGSGSAAYSDGTGTAASFNAPKGLAIDSTNTNIYVADHNNNKIRKIVLSTGAVSTHRDIGINPHNLAFDLSGNLVTTSYQANKVILVHSNGTNYGAAGGWGFASQNYGYYDGAGDFAKMYGPTGIVRDSDNNFYYVEYSNHAIRCLVFNGNSWANVVSYAGILPAPDETSTSNYAGGLNGGVYEKTFLDYNISIGWVFDGQDNIFFVDDVNAIRIYHAYGIGPDPVKYPYRNVITSITDPTAEKTGSNTIIGSTIYTSMFGNTNGYIESIADMCVDISTGTRGTLYILTRVPDITTLSDPIFFNWKGIFQLYQVDLDNGGSLTTLPSFTYSAPLFYYTSTLFCDNFGQVYIAKDICIQKVNKFTGQCTNFVGSETEFGYVDGTGTNARFHSIQRAITHKSNGTIYVYDNYRIRAITTSGVVTTLAGKGTYGTVDGTGVNAGFSSCYAMDIDGYDGTIWFQDSNYKLRKITTPGGVVTSYGDYYSNSELPNNNRVTGVSSTMLVFDHSNTLFYNVSHSVAAVFRKTRSYNGSITNDTTPFWGSEVPVQLPKMLPQSKNNSGENARISNVFDFIDLGTTKYIFDLYNIPVDAGNNDEVGVSAGLSSIDSNKNVVRLSGDWVLNTYNIDVTNSTGPFSTITGFASFLYYDSTYIYFLDMNKFEKISNVRITPVIRKIEISSRNISQVAQLSSISITNGPSFTDQSISFINKSYNYLSCAYYDQYIYLAILRAANDASYNNYVMIVKIPKTGGNGTIFTGSNTDLNYSLFGDISNHSYNSIPKDLCFDSSGNLYFNIESKYGSQTSFTKNVFKVSQSGIVTHISPVINTTIHSMTCDADGNIYYLSRDKTCQIYKLFNFDYTKYRRLHNTKSYGSLSSMSFAGYTKSPNYLNIQNSVAAKLKIVPNGTKNDLYIYNLAYWRFTQQTNVDASTNITGMYVMENV